MSKIILLALVAVLILTATPPSKLALAIDLAELERELIEVGVIDPGKFGGRRSELNILWAFGLAHKNPILEEGPMADPRYGGTENFASTGGWNLAVGDAMDHYSTHKLLVLTTKQQELLERVAKNIYRPCCNNSTHFPDCNHGMAMLGLLEILAAKGASEDQLYQEALEANQRWFPDSYATIERYLQSRGESLVTADPKEILGREYSSASGHRRILSLVEPLQNQGGASCST